MDIITVLVGVALLLMGRQLYWLFVAVVGFAAGAYLAATLLEAQLWVVILVALVAGLIGIGLARFAQRLAISVAAFVAGGLIALQFRELITAVVIQPSWLVFLIGGVIGALLVSFLFDWALIFLSSIVGAGLIVQSVGIKQIPEGVTIGMLAALGIVVQSAAKRRKR